MPKSAVAHAEGAELAYDVEGEGPPLLLIAGGNGDSRLFTRLSTHLADRYTVMKYDRRTNARSTGDRDAEMDMAQAGGDAAAVIAAAGGPAFVFGSSAGANIGLKLAEDHPQLVRGLVDHEPPITDFLPQPAAGQWRIFFDRVYDLYLVEGADPAMRLFASSFVGFERNVPAPGDQAKDSFDRSLAHEFRHINSYVPNLAALRQGGVPIVTVVGRDSGTAFYAETARELARQLPCACMDTSWATISATSSRPRRSPTNSIRSSRPCRRMAAHRRTSARNSGSGRPGTTLPLRPGRSSTRDAQCEERAT